MTKCSQLTSKFNSKFNSKSSMIVEIKKRVNPETKKFKKRRKFYSFVVASDITSIKSTVDTAHSDNRWMANNDFCEDRREIPLLVAISQILPRSRPLSKSALKDSNLTSKHRLNRSAGDDFEWQLRVWSSKLESLFGLQLKRNLRLQNCITETALVFQWIKQVK